MTEKERYIKNKREMRKRKKRMKTYIYIGIICIVGVLSFWFGKGFGEMNAEGKAQAEVSAMQNLIQEYINQGEPEMEKPQTAEEGTDHKEKDSETKSFPEWDKSKIILVNKYNKLPEDYDVELKCLPDKTNYAAVEAYQPLCDMLKDARKDGIILEVCSSYRDVSRQKELFEEDMRSLVRRGYSYLEAYDEVAKETMPPGYSEHSTGLAFDIVALDYQMLDERQEKTEENKWLRENCAKYGFILRYPKGKEEITGISYESWHFRYVGVEIAEYIMNEGVTLEEFMEQAS